MFERGVERPLGVIPAGTGNNLARGLGIPLDPAAACRVAFESDRTVPLDVVLYRTAEENRDRLIIQSGALGFPAEIALRYDRLRRHRLFRFCARPLGTYVYRVLALSGLIAQAWRERRGRPPLRVRCEVDGEVIEENVLAVFIGNEKSLGGNFQPCPLANTVDGLVDICIVRADVGQSYLSLLAQVKNGTHLALEDSVVYRQSARPVEFRLSRAAPLLADGDLWARGDHYRLEVVPRRFQIVSKGEK